MVVKVQDISYDCLKMVQHFECIGDAAKYLKAYQDTAGVWTIGVGTTIYPDGTRVKEGDVITLDEALEYEKYTLRHAAAIVDALTTDAINQHQFDALVDFVYNLGEGNYRVSTLRKYINAGPNNFKRIVPEFLKWHYSNHQDLSGLTRRRKSEAHLYVYGELKFYFLNNDNIIK